MAAIPNEEGTLKQSNNLMVFYNDQNLLFDRAFNCVAKVGPQNEQVDLCDDINVYPPIVPDRHYIEIFIECEFNAFDIFYNSSEYNTYSKIMSIFNEASLVYAMENIDIKLSEIHIINDENDQIAYLEDLINPSDLNVDFGEITNAFGYSKQNNYDGRLACLFLHPYGINTNDGTIGYLSGGSAWWDKFNCTFYESVPITCMSYYESNFDNNQPYKDTYGPYSCVAPTNDISNFPVYSFDVLTFAHEIGHNLGSPHTNNCLWGPNNNLALDDCRAVETNFNDCSGLSTLGEIPTIMSYCDFTPLINGFGQEPGDLIRSNYALGCGTSGTLDCHGDVSIFNDYAWLLNFVDPNNCLDTKITVWLVAGILPVFHIQDSFGGKLYVNFGGVIEVCDDGNTPGSCVDNFNFEDAIAHWTCRCCNGAIDATNFENGWANTIWQDGGEDCKILNSSAYSLSVPNSVELRDNSGAASSMTTQSMQLQLWDNLNVSFSFMAVSMEAFEDFFLELSTDGGASYTTVQRWIAEDFQVPYQFQRPASVKWFSNNVRYTESIDINNFLSSNTKLRFRCDASSNWDRVYIDNVVIRGCPSSALKEDEVVHNVSKILPDVALNSFLVYPNPVKDILNLKFSNDLFVTEKTEVSIFSLNGYKVYTDKMNFTKNSQIDVKALKNNQVYLIQLKALDGTIYTSKFMKK